MLAAAVWKYLKTHGWGWLLMDGGCGNAHTIGQIVMQAMQAVFLL